MLRSEEWFSQLKSKHESGFLQHIDFTFDNYMDWDHIISFCNSLSYELLVVDQQLLCDVVKLYI